MPQCQAAMNTERCQRSAQEPGSYCAEHAAESTEHVDAHNKANKDVEADRLDSLMKAAEEYEVRFGPDGSLSSKESISELQKERDTIVEVLAKAEFWKSVLKELEPQSNITSTSQQLQTAEDRCQAYIETEGCTPCPDRAAEGRRFCLAHDTNHSASLSSLEKARAQCREALYDYESAFGSGSREETIKLLQKYVVSLSTMMERLEEHQRQFHCKTGEQHSALISDLQLKRKKAVSQVDDLVLWDYVVSLAKKAAPFGSLACFVLSLCIVLGW